MSSEVQPSAPVEQDGTATIFETYTFVGAQGTFTTKATAFTGIPIDTEVVERLVKTRLREVERRVMLDVFDDLLKSNAVAGSLPVRDLVRAISSLATQAVDGDAKSQTLLAAIVRDGLALAMPKLVPPTREHACADSKAYDAAYMGLANSAFLHPLGFTEHTELDPHCRAYAREVSTLADAMATKLDQVSPSDLTRVRDLFVDVRSKCVGAAGLSLQARGLLQLGVDPNNTTLRSFKTLRDAFVRIRLDLTSADGAGGADAGPSDAGAPFSSCFDALNEFSFRFETALGPLAADTDDPIPWAAIFDTVSRVRTFLGLDRAAVDAGADAGSSNLTQELRRAELEASDLQKREKDLRDSLADATTKLANLKSQKAPQKQLIDELQIDVASLNRDIPSVTKNRVAAMAKVHDLTEALKGIRLPTRDDIQLKQIRDLVVRLAEGRSVRRGDLVQLVEPLSAGVLELVKSLPESCFLSARDDRSRAREMMTAVMQAIVQSVREDPKVPAGIRLDVPALTNGLLVAFREFDRPGLYLRATVGMGYGFLLHSPETGKSFYEELGFGYRWSLLRNFLVGPHLMTSGLLFQLTSSNDNLGSRAMLGGGVSLNAYKLLEVSTSFAWAPRLSNGPGEWDRGSAFLVGLQLPLLDYFQAISEGGSSSEAVTAGSK